MARRDKSTSPPAARDKLGAGSNRLTKQADISGSRFRKRYRNLADHELAYGDAIKDTAAQLEFLTNRIGPPNREIALALTYLEIAVMFAIKAQTGKPVGMKRPYTPQQITKIINDARAVRAT